MSICFHHAFCLECETLVRRILVVDPSKRYSLQQIKNSSWMQAQVNKEQCLDTGTGKSRTMLGCRPKVNQEHWLDAGPGKSRTVL